MHQAYSRRAVGGSNDFILLLFGYIDAQWSHYMMPVLRGSVSSHDGEEAGGSGYLGF